jgi:hypothetical protein
VSSAECARGRAVLVVNLSGVLRYFKVDEL